MPEVHVPRLDHADEPDENVQDQPSDAAQRQPAPKIPHGRSLLRIALEVVLIGTGVFLGLAGEQWREKAGHRELAEMSLHRFRSEILANRKVVADVKDYHVTIQEKLNAYLAADPKARQSMDLGISGIRPAFFERTAWESSLATQAVAYIDPDLVFSLSRVYDAQGVYAELTRGMMQAMYLRPPEENLDAFVKSLHVYYGDVVGLEPQLLAMYDEIVPQIDRALKQ
jgi:hypothetical protein